MSYVISIDVGIKNMGICIFHMQLGKVVVWENVSLVPKGKQYFPRQNVENILALVSRFKEYFDSCFQLVIERQMRTNMRIIESVLEALYFDNCTIISPRSVKLHYNLSTRNYKTNKLVAVQWVESFLQTNTSVAPPEKFHGSKRDDLADSLLMLLYYLDTYSNHLTTGPVDVELEG
jgi:hypothetical protein